MKNAFFFSGRRRSFLPCALSLIWLLATGAFGIDEMSYSGDYEEKVLPYFESGEFGTFTGTGGVDIAYGAFERSSDVGALIVLTGVPESYIKYAEVIYDLRDLDLSTYVMDYRGVGFSGRMLDDAARTHVDSFSNYVEDLAIFYREIVSRKSYDKLFFLAHSTGAAMVSALLADYEIKADACVFTSPLFQVNTGAIPIFIAVPLVATLAGTGKAAEFAPGQGYVSAAIYEGNPTTTSYDRWERWEKQIVDEHEELRFTGYTNGWVQESFRGSRYARRGAKKLVVPILILQAEKDVYTTRTGQRLFSNRAENCEMVRIPDSKHELLMERDEVRNDVLERTRSFILRYR